MRLLDTYSAVLRAAFTLLWVRLLLRWKCLPEVLQSLTPSKRYSRPLPLDLYDIAYYVDRWLSLFPYNAKGNCFPRSLVLYRFARLRGFPVCFHCGVRKMGNRLDGHAWLTLQGRPFHEPTLHWNSFAVTFTFPEAVDGDRQRTDGPTAALSWGQDR